MHVAQGRFVTGHRLPQFRKGLPSSSMASILASVGAVRMSDMKAFFSSVANLVFADGIHDVGSAAGKNIGEMARDGDIVGQCHSLQSEAIDCELQCGARRWPRQAELHGIGRLVAFRNQFERKCFRISQQPVAVHGNAIGLAQEFHLLGFGG